MAWLQSLSEYLNTGDSPESPVPARNAAPPPPRGGGQMSFDAERVPSAPKSPYSTPHEFFTQVRRSTRLASTLLSPTLPRAEDRCIFSGELDQ